MKKMLLVDYGSSYFQKVKESFEKLGVEFIETNYDKIPNDIEEMNLCGIVLTGSPKMVGDPGSPQLDKLLLEQNVPILGICYGFQLLMHSLGGKVNGLGFKDYGYSDMTIIKRSPINKGIESPVPVWMAHFDHVTKLADGFELYAMTPISVAMAGDESRQIYGVQYHPEAKQSVSDMQLLKNFVFDICEYGGHKAN